MPPSHPRRIRHPIVVSVEGEPVVVVGGGAIAERKVEALIDAGAAVTVVAPEISEAIGRWHVEGRLAVERRLYRPGDLEGARLAYEATGDEAVSLAVRAEADRRGIWLNVADAPELCDFYVPAVVCRGDLVVAVSTGGRSPGLARRIREWIDEQLGPEIGPLTERLSALRARWVSRPRGAPPGGGEAAARAEADRLLDQVRPVATREAPSGFVYLVGAGPGDPSLLTVKARDCLEAADVVVYDALVEESALDLCRPGAERLFVGKRENRHTIPQPEINALLVDRASRGRIVVRLKGGDPFIFGRGGEEAAALAAARIPFEVVPGVSAGTGVPASAGIPLTHRAVSSEVVFLTGHHAGEGGAIDWARHASGRATLVIFMGRASLPLVAAALVKGGRHPACPVAVISAGATRRQRTVVKTLGEWAVSPPPEAGGDPALIVVGEVVGLRDALARVEPPPPGVE